MKHTTTIIIMIILSTLFLCGCDTADEKKHESEYYKELTKTQKIAVVPADVSDVSQTITESKEISDFISALDMEHWKPDNLPETAQLAGTFQFSQEETLKFGQNESDREMISTCEILCYEEIPYLTLKIVNIKITFEVSDTVTEYLTGYLLK